MKKANISKNKASETQHHILSNSLCSDRIGNKNINRPSTPGNLNPKFTRKFKVYIFPGSGKKSTN